MVRAASTLLVMAATTLGVILDILSSVATTKSSPQKQMDQSEVDFRIWLESQRTDWSNPELPKKRRRPKHKKFQLKELTVLVPADAGPVETIIDQILQGEQNGREIRTKDGRLVAYVDGIVQRFNKKAHEAHQKKLKRRGKMPKGKSSSTKRLEGENSYPHGSTHTMTTSQEYYTFGTQKYPLQTKEETSKQQYDQMPLMMNSQHQAPESKLSSTEFHNAKKPPKPLFDPQLKNIGDHEKLLIPPKKYENTEFGKEEKDKTDNAMITKESYKSNNVSVYDGTKPNMVRIIKKDSIPELTWKNDLDIHLENLEGFMMNQFVEYSEPEEKDVTGSAESGQFSPKEDMENNLDPNMERKDVPANQSEYLIKKPQYDSENVLRREHQVQQLNNKRINIQNKMSAKQMFSKHNENLVDIHELDQDQNVEYLSTSPKLNDGSASATISSEEKVTSSFLGSYGPKPNIKKIYLDRVETKSMNENREYEGSDESKDPDKEAESLENPNETDKDIVTIPVNVNALPHIEKVQTQNKQKEKTTLTETLPENDIVDVSNIREHPPLIPAKDIGYFKEERGRLTYKNVQSENKPMYFSKSDGNHNNTKIELSNIKLQMPGKIKSPIAHQFGKASQSINTFLDNDKENYKFKKSTLTNPGLHKTLTSYKNKHKRTMLPQPSRWEDDSSPDYKKSSHSLEKEELSTEELDKHQNIELVELQNLIQEPEYENSQNANHIGTDEQFLHKENKYDNTLSSFGRPSTHELNTNMVSKYSSRADTHIPEIFHTGDSSGPKGRETQLIRELAQYPKKTIGGKGTKISEKGKLLFNSYDKYSFDHNFAAPGFKGQIEAMQDKFETTPLSEERYDKSDGMALQSQAAIDSSDGYSKPSQVDFTARSKGTQWPTKLVNLESHIDDFESESASSESLEKKPREQVKKKQRESDIEDEQTNETTELQNFVHAHNIREYNNDEKTIEHNTKIKTTHEDIYSNKKHIGNKVPVIIWAQKSIETVEPKKTYVDVIPKEDIFDRNINVNELKVKQDEGKARIPVNIFYKNKPKSNAGTKTLSKIYEPYNGDKLQASYKHKEIEDKVAKTHKNEYSLANYTTVNINKNEPKQNAVVKESESIESVESKNIYNKPIILTKQYISKKRDSSELTETNTRHKILYNNDNDGISGIKTEYTKRFMPISPFSYSEEVKYRSEGENTKIITNKKDAGNGLDIKPEHIIKYKKEDKGFYGIKTDFVRRLLPSESDVLENNYGSKIVNRNERKVNAEFNKDSIISPENVGGGSDVKKTPKTSIYPQILYNNENDGISGVKTEYTRRLMPSSSLSGKEEVKYRNENENRIISKEMDGENESDTTPEPIIKYKKENKGFSIVKTDFVRRLLPSDIDTLENKDKSTIADRNYSESNIVTKVFPENEIGASDSKLTPKTNINPQIFYTSENNGLSGVKTEYTRRLMPMPASSENEEVSMKSDNKTRRKLSKETDEGNEIKIKTKNLIKYKKEDRGFSGIKTDFVRRLLPFESDVLEQKDKYKNADKNGEERYSEAKMGTNVIPENEGSARKVKPYSQADTRPNIVYNNENDVISGVKTEYTRRFVPISALFDNEEVGIRTADQNHEIISNEKPDQRGLYINPESQIKYEKEDREFSGIKNDFVMRLLPSERNTLESNNTSNITDENKGKRESGSNMDTNLSSGNERESRKEFSSLQTNTRPKIVYTNENEGISGIKTEYTRRFMPISAQSKNETVGIRTGDENNEIISSKKHDKHGLDIGPETHIKYENQDEGFSAIKTDFVRRLLPSDSAMLERKNKYNITDRNNRKSDSESNKDANISSKNEEESRNGYSTLQTNNIPKILYNNKNDGISGVKTEYTRRFMPVSALSDNKDIEYRSENKNSSNELDDENGLAIKPESQIKYEKEDKEFFGIKNDFVMRLLPSERNTLESNNTSNITNKNKGKRDSESNINTNVSSGNEGESRKEFSSLQTNTKPKIVYTNENEGISGIKTEYTRRFMPISAQSKNEKVGIRTGDENHEIISSKKHDHHGLDIRPETHIKYDNEDEGFSAIKTDFVRRLLPFDTDTLESKNTYNITEIYKGKRDSESNIDSNTSSKNVEESRNKFSPLHVNTRPKIVYTNKKDGISGVKTEYTSRFMPISAQSKNEKVGIRTGDKNNKIISRKKHDQHGLNKSPKTHIKYEDEDKGFSGIKTDFVRRLLPSDRDILERKNKSEILDRSEEDKFFGVINESAVRPNQELLNKSKKFKTNVTTLEYENKLNQEFSSDTINATSKINGVLAMQRMQITQENIPAEEIRDNISCVSNDKSDEKPQVLHKIKFSENSTEQDFNETPDLISTEKLMQEKQGNDKECEENINKIKTMSSNNEIVNTNEDKFSEIKVLDSPQTSYSDEKNGFVGTKNNHVKRLMTKGEDEQKMYDNDVEENINDKNTKNGAQFSPQLKEETPDVHVVIAAQRMQSIQEGQSYNSNIFETRNKQKETFSTKDVSGDGAEYIEELAVPRHKSKGKNAQRGKMVIPKQVTNNTYITKQNRYNSESGFSAVKSDYLKELEPYKNKIVSDSSKNELFRSKLYKYDVALEDQDLFMPSASSYESLYKRNGAITNKHNIQNNRLKNISSHKEVANRILFNEYKNNINSANTIDIILPTTQLKNSYTISGKLNYDNITFRYKTGTEDETKGDLLHPVDNSKMLFKPITVRMLQAENNNSLWVNMNVTNDAEMKQRLRNDNGTIVSTVQSNTTEEPNLKINTHTPLVKVVPLEEKVNTSFVNEGTTDKAVPSIPKTDFETERSTKEQINRTKNNHTAKGVTNTTVNKTEIKPSITHIVKNEAIKSAQVSDQTTYMESKSPQQNVTLSLNIGDIERHLKLSRPTKYTFFREEIIHPSLDEYNSTREENANNRHFSPNDKNPKMQGVVDAELSGKPLASLHEEQDNYEAPKPFKLFGTEDKIVAHIIKDTEAVRIDDLVIPIKSAYKEDSYLQNPVQLKDKANNTLYRHEFTDNVKNEQLNVLPNNFSDNNTQETITHETDNSAKTEASMISETEPTVHPKQRFHPNEFDSNEDSSSEKYKVKSSKEEESEILGGDQFTNKVDKDEEDLPGVLMPDSKNVLKLKIIRVPPSALKGSHIKDVQGQNLGAPINLHVKLPRDEKMGRYLTLPEALKRGVLKVIGGKGQTGGLGPLSDVPVVFKHWNRMLDDPADKKKKIKKRGHKQRNQQRRRIAVRQSL